jgi:hypothetical protein
MVARRIEVARVVSPLKAGRAARMSAVAPVAQKAGWAVKLAATA